jgi:hypothetical protein
MKTKCVIDFADKTLKFNTNALQSKTGIYMVICKQCIAGGGNAVHIKQDCILPAQATAVTRVATGNKSCVEDVVCIIPSNPKAYIKHQLLIPNSVTDIKCGESTVAISNFSNEPKRIKLGTMIGFYEKLDDATTLIKITNDLDNNGTHWWSTEESVNSGGQSGKGVVRHEFSRCQDNQHISCVVSPKVENSVISGASTGQTGCPMSSVETSIKTESDGPLSDEAKDCLCQRVPKLVREPAGGGHELTDKCIPMNLGEGEVVVGVTLNGHQKKKLKKLL